METGIIMRGKDILNAVLIILVFVSLFFVSLFNGGINQIKKNWPIYRCNPIVMPFAGVFGHDAAENMTYCIQNAQSEYMSYILEPIHYAISVTNSIGNSLSSDMQSMRKALGSTRSLMGGNFLSIFSKVVNIRVEFQRVLFKFKDVAKKMMGIQIVFLHILTGGIDTGRSIVAGPIGKTLDEVSKI